MREMRLRFARFADALPGVWIGRRRVSHLSTRATFGTVLRAGAEVVSAGEAKPLCSAIAAQQALAASLPYQPCGRDRQREQRQLKRDGNRPESNNHRLGAGVADASSAVG